ncbi:MAG: tetratricopeptide repeat protein [Ktedonobacterales bacterium]|nr:tetratricopeptide repeat protein [Ktedonobacterales bacterium]
MTHATYQPEERARQHRLLTEQAISQALTSHWEDAATTNRRLLELFPRDLTSFNRLGKALSELGQYEEAKRAYTDALGVDPENNIARKNLARLGQINSADGTPRTTAERIDPRLFIEETGKTGFTKLVDLAPKAVLTRLSAGEQVYLQRERTLLYVANAAGVRIGRVEPRLASRLIKFMTGGNQYAAGIAEVSSTEIRLIIRETFQDPSQFGKVSFPTQAGAGEIVRGYIKDTMVRREEGDDDELDEDGEFSDEEEGEEGEEAREPELEEDSFNTTEE